MLQTTSSEYGFAQRCKTTGVAAAYTDESNQRQAAGMRSLPTAVYRYMGNGPHFLRRLAKEPFETPRTERNAEHTSARITQVSLSPTKFVGKVPVAVPGPMKESSGCVSTRVFGMSVPGTFGQTTGIPLTDRGLRRATSEARDSYCGTAEDTVGAAWTRSGANRLRLAGHECSGLASLSERPRIQAGGFSRKRRTASINVPRYAESSLPWCLTKSFAVNAVSTENPVLRST